jgi:hypothetical protein
VIKTYVYFRSACVNLLFHRPIVIPYNNTPPGALGMVSRARGRGSLADAIGDAAAARGEKRGFGIPSMLPLLSSPLAYFVSPPFFEHCVTWPRLVWRLPEALRPRVSNDLLSVRAWAPVTRCSLRLLTRAGKPVGGDPTSPTAALQGPEKQRAASTSTQADA